MIHNGIVVGQHGRNGLARIDYTAATNADYGLNSFCSIGFTRVINECGRGLSGTADDLIGQPICLETRFNGGQLAGLL